MFYTTMRYNGMTKQPRGTHVKYIHNAGYQYIHNYKYIHNMHNYHYCYCYYLNPKTHGVDERDPYAQLSIGHDTIPALRRC